MAEGKKGKIEINKEEIRTMKKDIARLQMRGPKKEGELRKREEEERRKREEELRKREEEELRKKEEEERKIAEEKRREEEERKKEEERRIEEELRKREEEERRKREEEERRMAEEARKRMEEERRKREELLKRRAEEEKRRSLEEEEKRILEELGKIPALRESLQLKRKEILEKAKPIEKAISIIAKREELVEEEIRKVEEREALAKNLAEKRKIEKERWEIEERRREIEKERKPWSEEKKKIDREVEEIELEFQKISQREEQLKTREREIKLLKEQAQLEEEKISLEKKLQKIEEEKRLIEPKKTELAERLKEAEENLEVVLEKERRIEEEKGLIEEEEKLAEELEEKERLEKERWEIEERRREIEKERWQREEEKREIEIQIKRIEASYQRLLDRGGEIIERLKEIKFKLVPEEERERERKIVEEIRARAREESKRKEEEARKREEERRLAEERRREEEERRKREEEERRQKEEVEKREKEEKAWEIAEREKREFLERIERLKKAREEIYPPPPPAKPAEAIIPPPYPKPSFWERFGLRFLIFLFVLIILAGLSYLGWWFFKIRKPPVLPPGPAIEVPEAVPEVPPEVKPEITIPPPLIPVEKTNTYEISEKEEILPIFTQVAKEEIPLGSFKRIVIKNLKENRLASLEEIAVAFPFEIPPEIFQQLEKDYTLAVYSQEVGQRIFLIAKKKENLNEALKNWEEKIKKEGVLSPAGEKIETLALSFRPASFEDVSFRYLTISRDDFGICYSLISDYFILTTSLESLKKGILRAKEELRKEIGQLFIVGFEGKSLDPKLESFFKKYKPGGIILLSKNIENKEQLKKLISDLKNLSLKETGLPLLVAIDQEGAFSPIEFLEEKTPQSEIEDQEEAYQIGLKRGQELRELGFNLNLAPVLDQMAEEDFYFNRSFQKPASESGELAKSLILGQKKAGILTAIKYFPGYGQIPFNPEEKLATLEKIPEISQFKKAREAEPELVMTANAIYKEIDPLPFPFSLKAVQFLRENLGEEILIVSDDLSQNSLLKKFPLKEILKKPIEAGVEILIFSGYRMKVETGLDNFLKMVENGEIAKEKIAQSVKKIIKLKEKLK